MARYKDVEGYRKLFDKEYKKTRQLISEGETHLDNLAEGFSEASRVIDRMPTVDVVPKNEVAREVEAFEKKVGQIYNHYVFEDIDYADDDVAIEAVINALTEVLNELAELKKKYIGDQNDEK